MYCMWQMSGNVILEIECENKWVRGHGMKKQRGSGDRNSWAPEASSQGSVCEALKPSILFLRKQRMLPGGFENWKLCVLFSFLLLPRMFGTRQHGHRGCGNLKGGNGVIHLLYIELHVHLMKLSVGRKGSQFYFGCRFWERNGRNKLRCYTVTRSQLSLRNIAYILLEQSTVNLLKALRNWQ